MANTGLMRTDVNNGHAIAYRCAGQGPPLVLLHGFTLDSRIWRRQLEDLSDQFMVVAWDAPGAGASPDPPNPFTIADWAHCLAGFLDVMGGHHGPASTDSCPNAAVMGRRRSAFATEHRGTAPGRNSRVRVDRDSERGACGQHGAAGCVQCPCSAVCSACA